MENGEARGKVCEMDKEKSKRKRLKIHSEQKINKYMMWRESARSLFSAHCRFSLLVGNLPLLYL